MNITLNPDQSAFVQNQIEEGQYINIDALISDAINLLADRHQRLAELREKVAIGTEQIRNGQVTDGELVFDRLQKKLSYLSQSDTWIPVHSPILQSKI